MTGEVFNKIVFVAKENSDLYNAIKHEKFAIMSGDSPMRLLQSYIEQTEANSLLPKDSIFKVSEIIINNDDRLEIVKGGDKYEVPVTIFRRPQLPE